MMRRLGMVVLVLVLGLAVASCGRRGNPSYPEGSDYPRKYPSSSIEWPTGAAEPGRIG